MDYDQRTVIKFENIDLKQVPDLSDCKFYALTAFLHHKGLAFNGVGNLPRGSDRLVLVGQIRYLNDKDPVLIQALLRPDGSKYQPWHGNFAALVSRLRKGDENYTDAALVTGPSIMLYSLPVYEGFMLH